ncbi:MAG TPA: replication-associated recombination protein A [Hungateiclostridium thermocellum]|jgi:putative ATPase|uniref:Replication-associated recombination protein A n=2 Tax=Acetivibrio thermocellus TaxID=1515 RepID=A3DD23_ACET2|nr:replication-associated recombination protein A [Acetivibrio thermocellus]CDG35307.1 Replication-associated recombination protein A [Acetivibrio thermocellus BC1]ABN51852.1 AAA ATPase central domain protein [Acetivibrio thermocellus ATCC 27405]ADU74673.1 AAA ATPase central domain protein [Acetivibrio thermocellus DSM 1313]ALX08616.1 MgsA AAA+ ATPase domain-containing protein [Acetivibrio thermocellus AD2]ANV76365.1 MgsA AAA+ ATPase domain-containing protein [Acetivibrio thermocellus DSM 2360
MDIKKEPLAYRMRPRTLEEFYGQEEIVGEGKLLNRMIKADRISSIILYGPPGTGKTSLARIIANSTKANFEKLNAVTAGVADIKRIVSDTQNPILNPKGRTVLFIDEIHRFNKSQQDALLPYVEDGTIILVGATTENPFFEVNKALISRSSVFMLKPLGSDAIKKIIRNALTDKERGLGNMDIEIEEDALNFLADICDGDARIALNALELAVLTSPVGSDGKFHIDIQLIEECIQKKAARYDKSGEEHYDNISAFIKSMRGSDPDAAVFYLARALYAGEDPMFLARRIMICAAEDVGMANPAALQVAVAAAQAVHMVGMPEARIILSQAAIMVATSPKSNSCYVAIDRALDDVKNKRTGEVPMHLRNAVTSGMKELGYGKGYKYAHDYPGNIVDQDYLPQEIKGTVYYNPSANGYELKIKEWLEKRRNKREI